MVLDFRLEGTSTDIDVARAAARLLPVIPASAQEGKPPAEQLEMHKPVTKKVAKKANLEVPQEKKAVYEEPKREYRPKVNDRDFWEAQQTYEHLKK